MRARTGARCRACAASAAAAPRCPRRWSRAAEARGHPRAAALRLHRGARARRGTGPTSPVAEAAPRPTATRCSTRRGRGPRRRRARPAPPARRASSSSAARTRAWGSSTIPTAPARPSDADGWVRSGDLAVPRRRRPPDGRRAEEGDHHPRRDQHRAPRDRGPAQSSSRGPRRPRWSALPDERLGERWLRLRRAACRAMRSTSPRMVERLRATGLATYKLPDG